jgi:hypothetical protein
VFEGKCEMIRDPASFDPFAVSSDAAADSGASSKAGS